MKFHLKKKYCLLLLFFGLSTFGWGQDADINIQKYGFEDGLSHRNVFKVQQDTSGFLWVATAQGLNRFDGHGFLTWRTDDEQFTLPNDHLHDLMLDQKNRLWMAFDEGGLSVFDLMGNKVDTLLADESIPKNTQFSNLVEDAEGRVWTIAHFPSDSTNYLANNFQEGRFSTVVQLPGKYKNRPIARIGGLTYVGAHENEIWVFDLSGTQVSQFEFPAPTDEPEHSRVVNLQVSPDGTLWALLDHGQIYFLSPKSSTFERHMVSDYLPELFKGYALCVNSNHDIWVGGIVSAKNEDDSSPCSSIQPGPSLFHYNPSTNRLEDFSFYLRQLSPYAEPPRQIYKDQTGVIWIATAFGLIRLVDHDLFIRYMSDGNDCCRDGVCSMRGITEDSRGNIYFSYYSSIHRLSPRSGSLVPLFSTQIGTPFGIIYHEGAIWTGEGLRIDLATLEVDTIISGLSGKEGVVMLDHDSELWFGNQTKLVNYQTSSRAISKFDFLTKEGEPIDIQQITWLHRSNRPDVFWIGTIENGVIEAHKKDGILRHFNTKKYDNFPHDRILAMVEAGGYLWFGSAAGLGQINLKTEQIQTFTVEKGMPNDFVNGVLAEGDSAVWASTDNGLARFDIGTGRFTNFFRNDGISKNEFNRSSFYQASDGRMYFGGIDGVNAFYPSSRYGQRDDKVNSRLVLTEFEKYDGNEEYRQCWGFKKNQRFKLSHNDEFFGFKFTLTDFTDPKIHLYSYKLDGYDQNWSESAPLNFARYFNIPAGDYTLRVKASRGGGDWADDELSIPISISQAFYKTRWFQLTALGLLTLLVFGIMRYRLHLLKEHEKELETLVQMRTSELAAEKHKSDELLLNILPAETAEELKKHGKTVARRYENVTVMFSDFKDFSKIATDMEPEDLVAEIDHCFRAFDEITELYGLEKIKTVGDAYLLAGGLSSNDDEADAVRVVQAALEIQSFLNAIMLERTENQMTSFEARIGIHTGPVVAGIVGIKKFAYDIWGDTVNIAERLQSSGEVGKVNISKSTHELVNAHFECTYRGKIEAKNKGEVDMYFVDDVKSP